MLRPAEDFQDAAVAIRQRERARLRTLGLPGTLVLVGGTSVAGALTRGDVDLHLRVPRDAFPATVAALEAIYDIVRPDIWAPTLATFSVQAALPTGLAATPVGSVHDVRFTRTWQLLAADPALVAEYNAVKTLLDGPSGTHYEDRKSAFFDHVLQLWPSHPAGGGPSLPSP